MSTFYPRSLSAFVNTISNYSRNTFKLLPYRTDGITPSQIIVVDLPSNALVDLDTLCLRFKMTTTATTSVCVPNKNIETIIDKLVVEINGQTLGSASGLNQVYDMLLSYTQGADLKQKRALYQNSIGQAAAPGANITDQEFAIHNWLGFISSIQPSCIDTGLLGSVRLHVYLAPAANALIYTATTAGASYTLNNVYYMVDTISIQDGIFYNLHNEFLKSGGVYRMPFQSIYTASFTVASLAQSNRFSLNTQSLDMLSAYFVPSAGNNQTIGATTNQSGLYQRCATALTNYNFEINGVQYPQFSASVHDAYPLTMNALCMSQDTLGGCDALIGGTGGSGNYILNYWAPMCRLNHPTADDERAISGLNTQGNSANIVFKSSGAGAASTLYVNAFSTSVLEVAAGRSINIIS
jgi:hypothetical protein